MGKQSFRYSTFLSPGQQRDWFFFCYAGKATGLFLIPTLYGKDKSLGAGGEGKKEENFEGPALPLAVIEGMPPKGGERRGLAKADSVIIALSRLESMGH